MISFRYILVVDDEVAYMANTITECRKHFEKVKTRYKNEKRVVKTAFVRMNQIDLLEFEKGSSYLTK